MTAARDGDALPLTPVAATVADESGAFQLRLEDAAVLDRFLAGDNSADLSVMIPGPKQGVQGFSVSRAELQNARVAAGREIASGKRSASAAIKQGPAVGLDLTGPESEADTATVDWNAYREKIVCTSQQKANYGSRWTAVGETYNVSGVRSDFHYLSGGSSSLGVGVSSTGSWGSWKYDSTVSKSASAEINFPATSGGQNRQWATGFEYRMYYVFCAGDTNSQHYEVRPTAWTGGTNYIVPAVPSATYCSPTYLKGSSFTKSDTSAVAWSNGVSLSGAIGVDMYAKSGFSSTVKVSYFFDEANRRLCGSAGYPTETPKRIISKL